MNGSTTPMNGTAGANAGVETCPPDADGTQYTLKNGMCMPVTSGGRRKGRKGSRKSRKTTKARKASRKGSRKSRKGSRKSRKGSRKSRKGSRRN